MSRYIRRETSLLNGTDDEDKLYERQALIEDDELCSDDVNSFGIRQRTKISNDNTGHELKSINGSRGRDLISDPPVEFTLYDIQPGDSLQSICLRYACSLNQVKRLNGLMTDQEFYGLRRIKLPLGKLGLLEDVLKSNNNNSQNNVENNFKFPSPNLSPQPRIINSPGSALSVSITHNPHYKPLLSPGFSSDKINELNRNLSTNSFNANGKTNHNHSHSFSSLRDFAGNDNINIDIDRQNQYYIDSRQLKHKTFIKSNLDQYDDNVETEDILMMGDNVGRVFEDLDYHVERAKAAVETYDQRAVELVDQIDINGNRSVSIVGVTKRSKIPDLFYCNENFGLSYKKLLIFILIVCLIFPLIYINQSSSHFTS